MCRFIRFLGTLALIQLLFSLNCAASEIVLHYHCVKTSTTIPRADVDWQQEVGTVRPNQPCWVRISTQTQPGDLITFDLPGIDLQLYAASGTLLAKSSKLSGHQAVLLHGGQVAYQPAPGRTTFYALLSIPDGIIFYRYPRIGLADSVSFSLANSQFETSIAMQTAVLCTFSFVAFIFWILLRKKDYCWFFLMTILNASYVYYSSGMLQTHFSPDAHLINLIIMGSWLSNFFHGLLLLSLFLPLKLSHPQQYRFLFATNLMFLLTAGCFLIDIDLTYILNAFTQSGWYLAVILLTIATLYRRSWVTLIALVGMTPAIIFYWPGNLIWTGNTLLNWNSFWIEPAVLKQLKQPLQYAYSWLFEILPQGAIWDSVQQLFFPAMFSCSLVYHSYLINRKLLQNAQTDALTGLPNRNRLTQISCQYLRQHSDAKGLVVALNIERFQSINQTLGYEVGDKVLLYVSLKLRQLQYVVSGRSHGDHFFVVLFDQTEKDKVKHDLNRLFSRPADINGQFIDTVISAGVAQLEQEANHSFLHAELALHSARVNKSRWSEYMPEMQHGKLSDLSILSALRHAIDENQLQMFLQPKFHLSDHRCHSAEALIRWHHPIKGMIPPADFIPFAESTGFISELTQWILRQAAQFVVAQRHLHNPVQIAVNLSTIDLQSGHLVQFLQSLLAETGASSHDLRLEITESSAMSDTCRAHECLQQLWAMGFSLSVDDFGTGYSSLAYLQKLAVHEIKIDRAFVAGCYLNEKSQALLRSMVSMARALHLSIVTEGVETLKELEFIQALGVDVVQGFLLAKPMSTPQFSDFYQHNSTWKP